MITAQEAKTVSLNAKRDTNGLLESVLAMAKSGNEYACVSIKGVRNPELSKKELEDLGYSVELTDSHLTIKW